MCVSVWQSDYHPRMKELFERILLEGGWGDLQGEAVELLCCLRDLDTEETLANDDTVHSKKKKWLGNLKKM